MKKSVADKKKRLEFDFYKKKKQNNEVLIINWYIAKKKKPHTRKYQSQEKKPLILQKNPNPIYPFLHFSKPPSFVTFFNCSP